MKKLIQTVSTIPLVLIITLSCQQGNFQFIFPLNEELNLQINENDGVFEEVVNVTYQDFFDDLDEIGEEAIIDRVDIEAIVLKPSNYQQNLQGLQNLNLFIVASNETIPIYLNQSINFQAGNEIVLTNLVEQGVVKISQLLKDYAIGSNVQPFTLISSGRSTPEGTPLAMNLTIVIKATLVFSQEIEVPFFMGE